MNGSFVFISFIISVILISSQNLHAADCASAKGIASNDVVALTGSSDTIWALTHEGINNYAANVFTGNENLSGRVVLDSNWNALYLCKTPKIMDFAFHSNQLVICADTAGRKLNDIFVFSKQKKGIVSKTIVIPWAVSKESINVAAVDVTVSDGTFFFACQDGGVAYWNSKTDQFGGLIPGAYPKPLDSIKVVSQKKDKYVESVNACGDTIIVTTSEKIWLYNQKDSSWDSSVSKIFSDSDIKIKSFFSAFFNNRVKGSPLYAFMSLSGKSHSTDSTVFCKYDRKSGMWRIFKNELRAITAGNSGILYMVSKSNTIEAYIDTLSDSVAINNPPLIELRIIQDSMTANYEIDFPGFINDVLYLSTSDSTGNLWIATSEGLFLSENVSASNVIRKCVLVKRAPNVSGGLKKTYARPGILTTNYYDESQSRSVFIYNLSRDANVTIRVYDYNMEHVKTVISGKARKAGDNGGPFGRSTVESEDWWDGSNMHGITVAPGVYYYKITADSGERAFGKIVVAK